MKKYLLSTLLIFTVLSQSVFAAPTVSPSLSPSASPTATATASPIASPTAVPVSEKSAATDETEDENTFPEPHCEAAILTDRKTGEVLYQKNADKKMYPASTTKIMTAVLAFENGNLSDSVTATSEATYPIDFRHSNMGIKVGETFTLEQLLYGMLVYSANDAANVIAVHIGGSLESFADMMNKKAEELNLSGTHFVNAHGFHDDNHYTTARDLATLTRYAMQNETFCEIVKTVLYRIPANDLYTEERVLSNTNHLISRYRNVNYIYKYAVGVKTGSTDEAGSCLVSAATKGDIEVIGVVLKADSSSDGTLYAFADSAKMYDYVFANYKYCEIASADDVVSDSAVYEAKNGTRVALSPKERIEKLMPKDADFDEIKTETVLDGSIKAPISKGDVLGKITYTYNGKELGTTELIAGNDVEKDMILAAIHTVIKIATNPIFIICVILLILFIISSNSKRKKRRKQRRNKLKYSNQNNRYR